MRAPVQPTESAARVAAAVQRLFPEARLAESRGFVEGPAGSLAPLERAIRAQRIRDTARGVLLRGRLGARTRFGLSKQAAAAGRLNFALPEGGLGPIEVELRAASEAELLAFVDRVAPDTRAWSLGARGLTERALREQEEAEARLDALDRSADEGPGPGA